MERTDQRNVCPDSTEKKEKQGAKRTLESDETSSAKKRKCSDTWSPKSSSLSTSQTLEIKQHNRTFANDRLKRLRNKICSDVSLSTNINPKVSESSPSAFSLNEKPPVGECIKFSGKNNRNQINTATVVERRDFSMDRNLSSPRIELPNSIDNTLEEQFFCRNLGKRDKITEIEPTTLSSNAHKNSKVKEDCSYLNVETSPGLPFLKTAHNKPLVAPNKGKIEKKMSSKKEYLSPKFSGIIKEESDNLVEQNNGTPISNYSFKELVIPKMSNNSINKNSANSRLSKLRKNIKKETPSKQKLPNKEKIKLSNDSSNIAMKNEAPGFFGKVASSIQERFKGNRFLNLLSRTDKVPLPKFSQTPSSTNISYASITSYMLPTKKEIECSNTKASRSSPSLGIDKTFKKNDMKHWINPGQIVDSLYKKFFSHHKESKISSNMNDSCRSSDYSCNQVSFVNGVEDVSMDWENDTSIGDESVNQYRFGSNNVEENVKREIYIVVDTNIFLSDLSVLKDIVSSGANGGTKPVLYVPWMVLSELDFMKDDRNTPNHLKDKVREAVKFINKTLLEGDRKLLGQNVFEAEQQSYVGKAPDEKILSCCLQAKEKNHNVILLSNDINLKNKLLVNGIPALSTTEILKFSTGPSQEDDILPVVKEVHEKMQKVIDEMSTCCSYIICECSKEAYGAVWNKMAMLSNPPWDLKVCLKIFKKYWSAVYRERLLKQCFNAIEKLEEDFRQLERSNSLERFDEFMKSSISLCIYFKDLEEHKDFVQNTIKDIRSITNSQL